MSKNLQDATSKSIPQNRFNGLFRLILFAKFGFTSIFKGSNH